MSNRTSNGNARSDEVKPGVRRRGLFAAAWAAVAGIAAMRTTQPVEAVSGSGSDGTMVLGSNFINGNNTSSNQTNLVPTSANYAGSSLLDCDAGVAGPGGTTANINGIYGHGKGTGAGVLGVAGGAVGVGATTNPSAGVCGLSYIPEDGGIGVRGELPTGSTANGIAIYGLNNSSFAGPGVGAGGFGVYGLSAKGHGLVGATASPGAAALVGATNGVGGAYAGTFYGPVAVSGDFTVVGGAKSAAVPHPDGSHRRLYCVESPESWFEDFGEAQVTCGRAEVRIDPDFGAVIDSSKYHVFLSVYDSDLRLHVSKRTPGGFTVEADSALTAPEDRGGPSLDATFSWRVVAKRKDITGERLATVTIPQAPALPDFPLRRAPASKESGRT
jgi:hypothetical protein